MAIGLGTEVDQALLQSISDTFLLISSYNDLPGRINDILEGVCSKYRQLQYQLLGGLQSPKLFDARIALAD